ncbi:hypothetical protein Poli38472_000055 [Pythium oligandrum]|uniref:FYVE-type domain-containing protein n=1 Tax=Pythium oligandrum TaxID=41045 RepID=A0A8K1FIR2_PYTOL|nr:hypothetical protein Poli38472_000055 [Pythium oligandrum]|eukprot:TMW60013.1 hypothetical protein Poli38472_000055 [Pythium oligandrum]
MDGRSRSASTTGLRFPLPDHAFPQVHVSDAQIELYQEKAHELVVHALHEFERFEAVGKRMYPTPWDEVVSAEGVTIMRRKDPSKSSRAEYRVFGRIKGDYRCSMEFFYAETAKEVFEWHHLMFQYCIDAFVVKNVQTATEDTPNHYMGIKWAAFQPLVFLSKLDMLFFEYMTFMHDLQGREVGVRVTLPINIPEIDHMMTGMKAKRFSSQIVQIFRPSEGRSPMTEVFTVIDNDFSLPVPNSYNTKIHNLVKDISTYLDSKRITKRGLISQSKWVPNNTRKSCVVCTRAFNATRGRHHCRFCGDVICRKCVVVRLSPDYVNDKIFKIKKTKFCLVCVTKIRDVEMRPTALSISSSTEKNGDYGYTPASGLEEDHSRQSLWSETESEDYTSSLSEHGDSRSSYSSHGSGSMTDMPVFLTNMNHHANRIEEEDYIIPEERSIRGTMEVIDTRDMVPEHRYNSSFGTADATNPLHASMGPSRSLDQNLAEQEELLRRIVLAASGQQPSVQ